MKSSSKFNNEAARRVAAIVALMGLVYGYLMPVLKGSTLLTIPNLPLNVYPILYSLLVSWGIAGILAIFQWYGVPKWTSPIFRSFESLFFWAAPGILAYTILFTGLAVNVPFVWTNFVTLFAAGMLTMTLGVGFYYQRKIMRETGIKTAIERWFPKKKKRLDRS
jgi:hypothetical protein